MGLAHDKKQRIMLQNLWKQYNPVILHLDVMDFNNYYDPKST